MEFLAWAVSNLPALIGYLVAILTGIIGICMLIPGPEPETTLRKIVDILERFSLKKK